MGNIVRFFIQSPDGKYRSFLYFFIQSPDGKYRSFSLSNPRMGNIVLFFIHSPDGKYRSFLFRFFIFSLSTSLLSLLQREILDAAIVVSAVGLGLISRLK